MSNASRAVFALAALAALAACVSQPAPPAPPAPEAPPPAPAPPPVQAPQVSWQDGPLSAGDWRYVEGGSPRATYGAETPALTIECMADRRIRIVRAGGSGAITVHTSFGDRAIAGTAGAEGASATIAASDPLLDQIAFSRGRFLVQSAGQGDLVVPSWPEPARVIDECRGQ